MHNLRTLTVSYDVLAISNISFDALWKNGLEVRVVLGLWHQDNEQPKWMLDMPHTQEEV
jgi:hypothetical protein